MVSESNLLGSDIKTKCTFIGIRRAGKHRPTLEYIETTDTAQTDTGAQLFAELWAMLSASNRQKLYRNLLSTCKTPRPIDLHLPVGDDSEQCWVHVSLRTSQSENGETVWQGSILTPVSVKTNPTRAQMCSTVFDTSPNKIAVFDAQARIMIANVNLKKFLEMDDASLLHKTPSGVLDSPQIRKLEKAIIKTCKTGKGSIIEIPLSDREGHSSPHVFKIFASTIGPDNSSAAIVYGHDIDNLVKLQAAVAETQDQLHAAVRALPDLFWIKDIEGRYVLCNDVFDEFQGVPSGAMIGKTAHDVSRSDIELERHLETDQQALDSNAPVTMEVDILSEDGDPDKMRHFSIQKVAIRNEAGEETGILGMARDISAAKRLEKKIRRHEREFRQLLDNLPDCIVRHDLSGKILYHNAALQTVVEDDFGMTLEQFYRLSSQSFVQDETGLAATLEMASKALEVQELVHRELEFKTVSGDTITHEIRYFPERGPDGNIASVLGVGRDVTDRKKAELELQAKERQLEKLAYTDSLTGLANRVKLQKTLRSFLDEAIARKGNMALLTLDIDRFKAINDTLGHMTGDELLVEFANRLQTVIGERGWLARLGGDEFVIILPNIKYMAQADDIALEIICAINRPMNLSGNTVTVSTSVGITVGPLDTDCDTTLFRFSDIALYHAKAMGRNRACRYTSEMSRETEERFQLEAMINDGLRDSQFEAFFQAKVELSSRRITGAEALCRWRHPEQGFIPPDKFIPVAEESGQIIEIGKLVLRQACEFAVTSNQITAEPFRVAVNVSARQFVFGGFLSTLGQCLKETGCKAEWLELEITESMLLDDSTVILETLDAIAKLGILISIDDFGTGYSALGYLRNLPIGGLKVDQSFVRGMDTDEKQDVLVRSVLAMAQGLKLKTVAEGVENEDIARKLEALGCEMGQGYLWHRPSPRDELLQSLMEQERQPQASNM